MAIIKTKDGKEFILYCQHTIGRDQNNLSCLVEKDISRKHAIISWENNSWQLTDLSSNGTKINHNYIQHSVKKIEINDAIQFTNNKKFIWEVVNLDPPSSFFKPIDTFEYINLNKGLSINTNDTDITFFKSNHQKWMMDNGEEDVELCHNQEYIINNKKYQFINNESLSDTVLNIDITRNACFQLIISVDEESITSKIILNDLELDLGNRVFNHLLLQLVRAKEQDLKTGTNDDLSGWLSMEELSKLLSKELLREVDVYYINTLIYRLRKNLINLPPYGFLFANIIERKKGKLRFGLPKFEIEKEKAIA